MVVPHFIEQFVVLTLYSVHAHVMDGVVWEEALVLSRVGHGGLLNRVEHVKVLRSPIQTISKGIHYRAICLICLELWLLPDWLHLLRLRVT